MGSQDVLGNEFYGLAGVMGFTWLISIAIAVFMAVVYWKIFVKADEPGWAILVPFYGSYVEFKIAFGNGWLFFLSFIPLANVIVGIMLPFKMASAFGKGVGYGFGLLLLPIIFYPMLAFGSSEYYGA